MTTPLDPSRAHAQVFVAMVRAGVATEEYDVYVAKVNKPDAEITYPHLVVWPPPVSRGATTLGGYDGNATSTFQITGVGRTDDEVLAALDRAAAALHRRRPVIPGRRCGLITQVGEGGPPAPQVDPEHRTADGQPVFFSFLQFRFLSTPVRPEGTVDG